MIVYIDSDEWYPVYSFEEKRPSLQPWGTPVNVNAKKVRRWKRVFAEFDKVQEEIKLAAKIKES